MLYSIHLRNRLTDINFKHYLIFCELYKMERKHGVFKKIILQGVAILFMLALHLFARKDVNGLYETFPMIIGVPLVYYLALFGDACVPILFIC